MAGELTQQRALLRAAATLEQIRLICDRTHEENLLAERSPASRAGEAHYAYALGAIMQASLTELDRLRAAGVHDPDSPAEANERALASLAAFRKSLRSAGLE